MTKIPQAALLPFLLAGAFAGAQDIPAASTPAPLTGFELPDISGSLRYAVNLSDRVILGYNAGNSDYSSPSVNGTLAYLSSSPTGPFSAVYTGTLLTPSSGFPTQVESGLSLSQVLVSGRWNYVLADSVQYTPETPVSGLSGVPGAGDANLPPLAGSSTGQGIQSVYAQQVSNQFLATATRGLTARTSLSFTGGQNLIRYLNIAGGSTTDEDGYTLSSALSHQFNASSTLGLIYTRGTFDYLASGANISSQTISVQASRRINQSLSVSGSIGPQFSSSSLSAIPSNLSYAAAANAILTTPFFNSSISFSRSINAGAGLVAGAEGDTLMAQADRQFGRVLNISGSVNYAQFTSLQPGVDSVQSLFFNAQVNRAIVRDVSAFITYTGQRQLNQGNAVSPLALNGTTQTLGFGLSYSPKAFLVGRH